MKNAREIYHLTAETIKNNDDKFIESHRSLFEYIERCCEEAAKKEADSTSITLSAGSYGGIVETDMYRVIRILRDRYSYTVNPFASTRLRFTIKWKPEESNEKIFLTDD